MEYRDNSTEATLESVRQGPPWENPEAGDMFQRIWQTIVQGVSRPGELFEDMRITGGLLKPLIFYVLIVGPALIVSQFILAATILELFFTLIVSTVLLPVFLTVGLLVSSGLTHLALLVFSGANQPFEATFRVNAYSYGSLGWIVAIPFCGSIIWAVWGIVLEVIGIARIHKVSTGKAAAAVLVPLAILFVFGMCLAVLVVALAASMS